MTEQLAPLKRPSFTPGARSARPTPLVFFGPPRPLDHQQPAKIAALLQRAKACLETWHDFATRADRMAELIAQGTLDETEFGYLRRIIEATEDRAAKWEQLAKRQSYKPSGDSEMSDAQVAAAIRHLTGLDADHAKLANDRGWRAGADSSAGHWCYAMLRTDHIAAIAVGRTIVGSYTRQLAMAGII